MTGTSGVNDEDIVLKSDQRRHGIVLQELVLSRSAGFEEIQTPKDKHGMTKVRVRGANRV